MYRLACAERLSAGKSQAADRDSTLRALAADERVSGAAVSPGLADAFRSQAPTIGAREWQRFSALDERPSYVSRTGPACYLCYEFRP
jgi:hypothetical protein